MTVISLDYNRGVLDIITENNFLTDENSNYDDKAVWVGLSDMPIVDRNHWSNYTTKYLNAKEVDGSGVWDTPYAYENPVGQGSVIDYHPLVNPITDFEIHAFIEPNTTPTTPPTETPTATPTQPPETTELTEIYLIAAVAAAIIIPIAAAVWLRKRK